MTTKDEILQYSNKYTYISKYYADYIDVFIENSHPLLDLIASQRSCLNLLNAWLEKLDAIPSLEHLIKKSKNSLDFFNILSEIKVAAYLVDKVGKNNLEIISSDGPSPDFKITCLGKEITFEVKRIEDKMERGKGNIKYDEKLKVYEINDISTIYNSISDSINEGQYYSGIPHIIIFDYTPGVGETEFEDVLYPIKSNTQQLYNINGELMGYGNSLYDGLFYKKSENSNFLYSCLSGVAAIFEGSSISRDLETESTIIKEPGIVFFRNPNADIKIGDNILSSLGMKNA